MDVVYPYKATADDFELRYSLRSLVNVEHDRVIIAGDRPKIISDAARYVPVEPVDNRYMSSTANILAAAKQAVETDDFIVMNDDIFILDHWTFQHEHRCTVAEYLDSGLPQGAYRAHIERTRDILKNHGVDDPLWFGLHKPTVYNRAALIDLCEQFACERYLLRTLYHNLFSAPSIQRDDVKVHKWTGNADYSGVVSISDEVGRNAGFRSWINSVFPDRCEYEISGRVLLLGYSPSIWTDLAACLGSNQKFDAVIASPEVAEHWPGDVVAVARDDDHAEKLARMIGFDEIVWCGRSEAA